MVAEPRVAAHLPAAAHAHARIDEWEAATGWILDRFAVPGTQVSSVYVAETCRSACTVYASE